MKLSTTTDRLEKFFGINKAVDILADAGFDAVDLSFFSNEKHYNGSRNKEYYTELRKYAESKGVIFNQAHAPFPSSVCDEEKNEVIFKSITESIKNASFLGIKNIIVHPCQHLPYIEDGNAEMLFEYNMDFYKKLIPYSEEYGIKIALENMWQNQRRGFNKIVHSTCSRPQEFVRYLDELNNDCFVGCLDVGHAVLVCEELADFVKALGNKRLKALHVHDVDGIGDNHTLPYFGIVDWDKFVKALADIGYEGDLTFEADGFMNGKPEELLPDCSRFMERTGRLLVNKFETYKKGI